MTSELHKKRMQLWVITQGLLLDDVGAANWDAEEKRMAAYFHERLFRNVFPAFSDIRQERDRVMTKYNRLDPKTDETGDDDL